MRWGVVAVAAAIVLAGMPGTAATRAVTAQASNPNGGEPFRMIVGIPKALTRNGETLVGAGSLAQNTIYAFPEKQGVTLAAPLNTGARSIPKGTKVDSWYVCVDTDERAVDPGPRGGTDYTASIRFDNRILLATILRPEPLKSSARVLGAPGVTYASSRFVGVDPFWMGQDGQWYDGRDFLMRGNANGIDCMRLVFRAK